MPPSKVPCLQCSTLVSKSNVTHLCRPCYLLSLSLRKDPRPSSCLGVEELSPFYVIFPIGLTLPLGSKTIPPSHPKIMALCPKSSKLIPPYYSKIPTLESTRGDVIQPRGYSHQRNFFDRLPHDLLIYTSAYLQLDLHSYLIDEDFANLVKRVHTDLGQLTCVTGRLFPMSDKIYTLVCKMQGSVDRMRCIFDNYLCGVDSTVLKKAPTHYYYDPDPESPTPAPNQSWSPIDYTTIQRTGRRKARTLPHEMRPSIVEAIVNLQNMNQIIIGFSRREVQKLPVSSTKGAMKIFPRYLKHCQEWEI